MKLEVHSPIVLIVGNECPPDITGGVRQSWRVMLSSLTRPAVPSRQTGGEKNSFGGGGELGISRLAKAGGSGY